MKVPDRIEKAARARIARLDDRIEHSLDMVDQGVPLAAEPDAQRLIARLQAKAQLSEDEARMVAEGVLLKPSAAAARVQGPEKIWGKTVDFVGVSFLERGYVSARSVARVSFRNGAPLGSGFMVSDRLFLTNNHVIGRAAETGNLALEFDYELDVSDHQVNATRFALDPAAFFQTDDQNNLDFTLVAVGPRLEGTKALSSFGWCQLSDAPDKHALGEFANIVQHPDGRYKEVVLRENRLVSRLDTVLHYVADTEPGSSGSPVFNNEWLVIALHHWGGPWRQRKDASGKSIPLEVNEGIRASAIITELKARKSRLSAEQQVLLEQVFRAGTSRRPPRVTIGESGNSFAPDSDRGPRMHPDGSATWQIPVEISVRLPAWSGASSAPAAPAGQPGPGPDDATSEAAAKPNPNYSARKGYNPTFINGHNVPLPGLTPALVPDAAKINDADDEEFELKYLHFSVVMNARRRLAFFTASNIDGSKSKKVDRKTGDVTPFKPGDGEVLDAEGAEASETWYEDPRIDADAQTDQALYDKQKVPGFPDPRSKGRMDRMLQRGHLVRRMDPAWGSDQTAIAADADTFHFSNCTPQLGFFNMGSAKSLKLKKSGGGQLWRALEDHVLNNAAVEKQRVCCFTGPVFNDTRDPEYRTVQVPMKFWKIVVWSEGGALRSLAMLADQEPVLKKIKKLPEKIGDEEALDELANVKDFLSTVARIEQLTKLDFGVDVRNADIRAGEAISTPIAKPEAIPLKPRGRRRR